MEFHGGHVGPARPQLGVDPDVLEPVADLGPRIEHHSRFPQRANVEFVAPVEAGRIRMRIWERGVGETPASGTGATSAAFAALRYRNVAAPVRVGLPGGEMVIDFDGDQAWMTGPGRIVYEGVIER